MAGILFGRHFAHRHQARIDETAHDGAARVDGAIADHDLESGQHFGGAQDQGRVVNLEDGDKACQPQQRGVDFDSLAGFAENQ